MKRVKTLNITLNNSNINYIKAYKNYIFKKCKAFRKKSVGTVINGLPT